MRFIVSLLALLATTPALAGVYDIRDYGAVSNDGLNDAPALQAATDAAKAAGGGQVYIPSGVWDVNNSTCERWCSIFVYQAADIEFVGEGRSSLIRSMPGAYSGDWYVFRVHDSDRITFRDFQLDGNRWAISSGDEQTHQIQVTYSRDVTITRMFFIRSWGDGVRVLGDETFGVGAPCERVDITDSVFTDMRRNGITVQRAWRGGTIANNTFLLINDGAIDFEPTGCATSAQEGCTGPLLITSNRIYQAGNHAVAVTLTGSTGVQFVNNTVYGNVQGVHVRNAVIANNIINASQTTNFRPIIDIIRDSYRVTVKDNILTGSGGKEMGISFKLNNGSAPHDISIKDNDITGVQTGVHLIGVGLARVKDNAITAWEVGVYADAREGFPIYALQVFSNQIRGPKYGILLVAKSGDVLVSAVRLNTIVEWTVEAIRYASKPEYIMDVSESDNLVD